MKIIYCSQSSFYVQTTIAVRAGYASADVHGLDRECPLTGMVLLVMPAALRLFIRCAQHLPTQDHCCWRATRKPRPFPRTTGLLLMRAAERKLVPTTPQAPPRRTRSEPDAGPEGLTTGLPVG